MTSVRAQILALAKQYGIDVAAPGDHHEIVAEAISRLSDNEVPQDDAFVALVRLSRLGVITQQEGHAWIMRMDSEDAISPEKISS